MTGVSAMTGMTAKTASTGRAGRDGGSATVWVLAACALLALGGFGAVLVGGLAVARHRTAGVADLAALAAASSAVRGDLDPCRQAALVAGASGAVLDGCRADPRSGEVVVRVSLVPAGWPPTWGRWSISARAGPTGGG